MKKSIKAGLVFMTLIMGILLFGHRTEALAADVIEGFHGGTGTKADPYQIATVEEFEILRGNLKVDDGYDHADYRETYFVLVKDINYDSTKPLTKPKLGLVNCKINGNGHSVNNISSTGNPLFNRVNGTEIKNISFRHCKLKNTPLIAKEVFDAKLSNVDFLNSKISYTIKSKKDYAASSNYGSELRYGGLTNWAYTSKFENITANTTMTVDGIGVYGMLCGHFQGDAKNCLTQGKVNVSVGYKKGERSMCVGAMFGCTDGGAKNLVNKASVTVLAPNKDAFYTVAGISGSGSYLENQKNTDKYYACQNQGKITVKSKWHKDERQSGYVAGIEAGYAICNFDKCQNSGKLVANDIYSVAGITNDLTGIIKNCKNTGTIEASDTRNTAGIANVVNKKVVNCKNTGKIKNIETFVHDYSGCAAAGIANTLSCESYRSIILNCTNSGEIKSGGKDGLSSAVGIVNIMEQSKKFYSTVKNCKNTGTITGDWWASGIVSLSGNWQVKNNKNVIASCKNTGTIIGIKGGENKPGILGYNQNTKITNCVNKGTLKKR